MRENVRARPSRWNGRATVLGYEDDIPIVAAVRDRRYPDNDLLIVTCPFCAETHVHGACGKDSPRGFGDGHRVADCVDPRTPGSDLGYIVVEVDP